MQGIWTTFLTVWGCKIDGNLKADLASSEDVVEERFLLFDLNLSDCETTVRTLNDNLLTWLGTFLKLGESYWPSLDFSVSSWWRVFPRCNHHFTAGVAIGHSISVWNHLIVFEVTPMFFLAFWLVKGLILSYLTHLFGNGHEHVVVCADSCFHDKRALGLPVASFLLLTNDFDLTTIIYEWVFQFSHKRLILAGNNLVERKLVRSDELLFGQVVNLGFIINIIYFYYILIRVLKKEVDLNRLNKVGVCTVI